MSDPLVIGILGGTGFVGRALCNRLTRDGHQLRVLTRTREQHRDMLVLPTLTLIEADVFHPRALADPLAGCDVLINLVGILNERGDNGRGFHRAHVTLTEHALQLCRECHIPRYLHMSALHAHPQAHSFYQQSKGRAQALALAAHGDLLKVTVLQPSVIFGADDSFLNRFADLLRRIPLIFPLAKPRARFAPVYVNDVAEAFAATLQTPASGGAAYDLCGPRSYTLMELVRYVDRLIGTQRTILPLPDWLAALQANVLEYFPGKPFSRDNLRSLRQDSVSAQDGLTALGVPRTPLEAIAPTYLQSDSPRARYTRFRSRTR